MIDEMLQRCRGALGVVATWSVVWGIVFTLIGLIIGVFDPDSIDPGESLPVIAGIGGLVGLVSGALFSTLLAVAELGKRIQDLSLARVALWGAAASAVFPLLSPADNSMLILLCPIGAAVAASSIAVAKRAAIGAATEVPALTAGDATGNP